MNLLGQTDHWCFPITGEETWAGVAELYSSTFLLNHFHSTRSHHHEPPTQQFQSSTPFQS